MLCFRKLYDRYYVSNKGGKVFSLRFGKFLKEWIDHNGYGYYIVYIDGKPVNKKTHHLVSEAFPEICGERLEGYETDHLDGNKRNNDADNLRYVSRSMNCRNPKWKERQRETRGYLYNQYTLDGKYVRTWKSLRAIYDETGIRPQGIYKVCKGKAKTAGGFKWMYA